jgi:EmrB/QacA subfamily drug resistance transporter
MTEVETGSMPSRPPPVSRRLWLVFTVLVLGQFMAILDTTAVNVSLPSIQRDLHMSQVSLSWVSNGYLVTLGACLLVAGRLGDLLGRKQVFLAGLGVFTIASLLCGLSRSDVGLVSFRFLQGVGAALESAMILGIIVNIFHEPVQRKRAISVYAFMTAAGGSIGLLIGGVITASLGWHWIFFINLPIGAATVTVGLFVIERYEGIGIRQGVDIPGAVTVTAAGLLAVVGFVQAGYKGWASPLTLGSLVAAAVLGACFVVLESRVSNPLVPLRVLRSRNLLCAAISRSMFSFGSYGSFFLLVLYLQEVLGFGSLGNGLAFLPNTIFVSLIALTLSPHLMARIGSKKTQVIGLGGFTCGLLILLFLPVHGNFWVNLFPAMAVLGISGGTFTVPNTTIAMAVSNSGDSGLVSGVINVAQQMGAALGIAVLASVSSLRTVALTAAGDSHHPALVGGFHVGFLVGMGALVVGVIAGLLVRPDAGRVPDDPVTAAAVQVTEVELL